MLHYLVGGAWGAVILRFVESGMRTLPLMVILFIPILLGMDSIYSWANETLLHNDEHLHHIIELKQPWLSGWFFILRAVVYFASWAAIAYFLNRWSTALDETAHPRFTARLRRLSGGAMPLLVLTVTFAAFDWMMSLTPIWFSGIYGAMVGVGMTLQALVLVIVLVAFVARFEPMSQVMNRKLFGDLGNLTLALVMIWAYLCLSQLIIIWSANLPEETPWYLARFEGPWVVATIAIAVFHFFVPFMLLLNGEIRRSARALSRVAWLLLLMRYVDMYWLIAPAFDGPHPLLLFQGILAAVAVGGAWMAYYFWQLKSRALVPVNNPHMREVHEHA